MPSITAGSKVLVTGANGFIATWITKNLLEKGYAVRGTVRSLSKGADLQTLFAKYGDKFQLVVVEDISKEGAFDEAVKGVDAIEHTATPVTFEAEDPVKDIIEPAVNGTVGILKSALRHGSSVKRIVVTSSTAAVVQLAEPPLALSEADYNEQSIAYVNEAGKEATGFSLYAASKTLADKAAWEFVEKNKGSITWDLTVINPPWVFGPPVTSIDKLDSLNLSNRVLYDAIVAPNSSGKSDEYLATDSDYWIDIRDLAEAHVLALEKEKAGGERIMPLAGPFVWQDWLDAANSLKPSPLPSHTLPKGNPGAGKNAVLKFTYVTDKAQRILGLKTRSKEETARDLLAYLYANGI